MTDSRNSLVDRVLEGQWRITQLLHAAAGPVWRDLDLTMAQVKTLFILAHDGPATIGHVAEAQGVSLPTGSHLVDRLVQASLVVREQDKADRRRTLARLTPNGEELVQRLQGGRSQLRAWLEQMDEADLAALLQGVEALIAVADSDSPTDAPDGVSRAVGPSGSSPGEQD